MKQQRRKRSLLNPVLDRFKDPTRYQYGMLRELADTARRGPISVRLGTTFRMTTFNSCLYWGWVELVDNPRKKEFGWKITRRGLDAIQQHENAEYHRTTDTHKYSAMVSQLHAALAGKIQVPSTTPPNRAKTVPISHGRRRVA